MADKMLELLVATVNDLTVAVHNMRQEMNEGFKQMSERLDRVEDEVQLTRTDLKVLAQKYGEHEVSIESLKKAR